jgi:glycosyltransferase involved in cell wall biosynthesis
LTNQFPVSTVVQETARPPAPVSTRPPRILLACDWLLKYAAGLAQGLREAGADVALLTRDHGLEYGGDTEEMRAELRARLGADAPLWLVSGRIRELGGLRQLVRVRSEIRRFGADLTHFQQATMIDPRLFVAAARRPGRYATTLHDPTVHPGDQHPGRGFFALERLMFTGAGVTFTHGQALVAEIHERKPWLHGPVEIVPHGVDVLRPAPLPAVPTLLFFGRISHYKGLDVLLAAMPQVWASAPQTRLVIAGYGEIPPSDVLGDARVTLRNEHVPESVVPGLYNDATAVVLPYRQASQSGVGSLAKAYGRASVVTNEGGLPELVADGSGIVVPSEDAGALANALIELITEPGRAAAMGAAATASAQAEFSWKAVGQATLDAYRRHGLLR